MSKENFWTIPNFLSLFRLLLVPVFVAVFLYTPGQNYIPALIIFLIASFTDVLDGIIARSTNSITNYGIVLDPLADKMLKIAALICFCIVGVLPTWLVAILIIIDFLMIVAGALLYRKKITIPSNFVGKLGTAVMSIGLLMCFFASTLNSWNMYVLYAGLLIIVLSSVIYLLKNVIKVLPKLLKKDEISQNN